MKTDNVTEFYSNLLEKALGLEVRNHRVYDDDSPVVLKVNGQDKHLMVMHRGMKLTEDDALFNPVVELKNGSVSTEWLCKSIAEMIRSTIEHILQCVLEQLINKETVPFGLAEDIPVDGVDEKMLKELSRLVEPVEGEKPILLHIAVNDRLSRIQFKTLLTDDEVIKGKGVRLKTAKVLLTILEDVLDASDISHTYKVKTTGDSRKLYGFLKIYRMFLECCKETIDTYCGLTLDGDCIQEYLDDPDAFVEGGRWAGESAAPKSKRRSASNSDRQFRPRRGVIEEDYEEEEEAPPRRSHFHEPQRSLRDREPIPKHREPIPSHRYAGADYIEEDGDRSVPRQIPGLSPVLSSGRHPYAGGADPVDAFLARQHAGGHRPTMGYPPQHIPQQYPMHTAPIPAYPPHQGYPRY